MNIRPLRVAIIGSGPAGMYALEHLQAADHLDVEVDLFDRLPVPWGLVRYGVAPDHPEKKLIGDRLFNYFLGRHNVRFFGNVEVGKDIQHAELAEWYDGVIYAVGAGADTPMGIPGEDLSGSWAAREFVAWYNGHPDFSDLKIDLAVRRAVIVGNGNVALDVARILTLPIEELERTDIADYAIEALAESSIEEIVILGRRGSLQGAFNNPELEELEHLEGVAVSVEADDLPAASDVTLEDADWHTRRKIKTLRRLVQREHSHIRKRIVFRFQSSPTELSGEGKVEQVRVVRNQLENDENGNVKARATDEESLIEAGLVFRAIGYRGVPVVGLPFDEQRGVVENECGRVSKNGESIPGVYVTGWIKRGSQGIIGTNKQCAGETVGCFLTDLADGKINQDGTLSADEISAKLDERNLTTVSEQGWRKIDLAEREEGRKLGRPRVKFYEVDKMLEQATA